MELRVNRRQLLARKREGKSERTVCRALILRFISVREGLEHLISAGRTGTVLSREECELVQFYLSEILTILKDL
jgi:hypothetical protein